MFDGRGCVRGGVGYAGPQGRPMVHFPASMEVFFFLHACNIVMQKHNRSHINYKLHYVHYYKPIYIFPSMFSRRSFRTAFIFPGIVPYLCCSIVELR